MTPPQRIRQAGRRPDFSALPASLKEIMMRQNPRAADPEIPRNVEISGFRTSVRISAVHGRGEEPQIQNKPDRDARGVLY
jgi:hypothetical protein